MPINKYYKDACLRTLCFHDGKNWEYDRNPDTCSFVQGLRSGIMGAPLLHSLLKKMECIIYVAGNMGETHLARDLFDSGRHGRGSCEPYWGDIYIAREYRDVGREWKKNDDPLFVVAHEVGHVIDSRLGTHDHKSGEPTSLAHPYALDAYTADLANLRPRNMFQLRAGLLSDENDNSKTRHDHSEVLCDLMAYRILNRRDAQARAMRMRYPLLDRYGQFLLLVASEDKRACLYRGVSGAGMAYKDVVGLFTRQRQGMRFQFR